jgi:uncharacterized membrane protein (DUF485 family)
MHSVPEDITPCRPSQTDWDQIVATRQFKDLVTAKNVFIIPVFVFFLVYYFTLRVMVGLAPRFMPARMLRGPNFAHLFALSQFFVARFVAWRYLKAAGDFGHAGEPGTVRDGGIRC